MLRSRTQVKTLSTALVFGTLAATCTFSGSAQADPPQQQGHVNLQTQANVRITFGSDLNLRTPKIAGAGDVNGDGIDDLIVGASPPGSMPGMPNTSSGAAFVIFGSETLTAVDPGQLGENGFRIDPGPLTSDFGRSVAGAGDVNGDGLDDVIIGESYKTPDEPGYNLPGAAYIVFGKRSTTPVNVAALGDGGFEIEGNTSSVAGAGDLNQDGLADVIVGQYDASNNGYNSGSAWVVFGKRGDTETIDRDVLGDQGFRIDGAEARDWAGLSVAGADDVNGDGRPDVVVGAPRADHGNGDPAKGGVAYVIYGKGSAGTVDLGDLRNGGFRIRGEAGGTNSYTSNGTGWSVDGAGDMNGDGLADVIVGAPYADHNGRINSGSTYIVNGKLSADDVNLANLGDQGFRIDGAVGLQPGWTDAYSDKAGYSVAGVGDVNGGGYDDVIIGAHGAYPRGVGSDGAAYVVYGSPAATDLDLATLGTRGFQMDGDGSDFNSVGWTVAGAGDFNGDGSPDVAVGSAVGSYSSARSYSAYVVYGFQGGTDNLPISVSVPPKEAPKQATSTRSGSCRQAIYESTLEVPREARLADLIEGKGLRVKVSASERSKGSLKVEIAGQRARQFRIFRSEQIFKKTRDKNKVLASTSVNIAGSPKAAYLKVRGETARLIIKRALNIEGVPKRTKLKVSLTLVLRGKALA